MEPTQEDIEAAKGRDERLRLIDLGIELDVSLANGRPLKVVLQAIMDDRDKAMAEFAYADLGDSRLVMTLQARVFRCQIAWDTWNNILTGARFAERELRSESETVAQMNEDESYHG